MPEMREAEPKKGRGTLGTNRRSLNLRLEGGLADRLDRLIARDPLLSSMNGAINMAVAEFVERRGG